MPFAGSRLENKTFEPLVNPRGLLPSHGSPAKRPKSSWTQAPSLPWEEVRLGKLHQDAAVREDRHVAHRSLDHLDRPEDDLLIRDLPHRLAVDRDPLLHR